MIDQIQDFVEVSVIPPATEDFSTRPGISSENYVVTLETSLSLTSNVFFG